MKSTVLLGEVEACQSRAGEGLEQGVVRDPGNASTRTCISAPYPSLLNKSRQQR